MRIGESGRALTKHVGSLCFYIYPKICTGGGGTDCRVTGGEIEIASWCLTALCVGGWLMKNQEGLGPGPHFVTYHVCDSGPDTGVP